MSKLLKNIKNNYWLIINAIMPFIIFFIPIYAENYVDEQEITTFIFNFYNIFDFQVDVFFSILCLFVIITAFFNLLFFILLIIENVKIEFLYKNLIKFFVIINNIILTILSLTILIYIIILSCKSGVIESFKTYNTFYSGTVIFAVYAIVSNLFIIRNYKRK